MRLRCIIIITSECGSEQKRSHHRLIVHPDGFFLTPQLVTFLTITLEIVTTSQVSTQEVLKFENKYVTNIKYCQYSKTILLHLLKYHWRKIIITDTQCQEV
jgi:hypothetical protein